MDKTTLSFRKGDIIHSDMPYATALDAPRLRDTCNWCFTRTFPEPITCSACSRAVYCSTRCQDKDPPYHRFECLFLQAGKDSGEEMQRFALRTLARLLDERESNDPKVGYFFEHRRTYQDLISHADVMEEPRKEKYRKISEELAQFLLKHGHDVSEDLIVEVLQKLAINAHGAEEFVRSDYLFLGHVVYLGTSKIDHTCELMPEYIQIFMGNRTIFKALADFTLENSLQLRCHYLPLHYSYTIRQEVLRRKYYFECRCKKCLSEMFDYRYSHFDALESLLSQRVTPATEPTFWLLEPRFEGVSDTNFYKNRLMSKLLLECSVTTVEKAFELGTSAIKGCRHHHDRLKLMCVLCRTMARFGANLPCHKLHKEFRKLLKETLRAHADVYGENHEIVEQIARMTLVGVYKTPLPPPMVSGDAQPVLET